MIEVTILDSDGDAINHLTQWDCNQTIVISDSDLTVAPDFHFCNCESTEALVVPSTIENGVITVSIPNILLEEPFPIIAYMYLEGRSIARIRIPLKARVKPSDYEYVENIDTVSATVLKAQLESALDDVLTSYDEITTTLSEEYATYMAEIEAKYAENLQSLIESVGNGAPKATFATEEDLEGKESGIYYCTEDGYVYYWDGESSLVQICLYQSNVIAEGTITYEMLADTLKMLAAEDNRTFDSYEEAEAYLNDDSCTGGQIVKVLEDGVYTIYIVQPSDDTESGWDLQEASMGTASAALTISSFSVSPSTAEIGSTVSSVTFTWAFSETPYTITVAGIEIEDTSTTSYTLTQDYTETTTFTLSGALKKSDAVTKTATLSFCHGVYYGTSTVPDSFDNDFVLSLTRKLVTSKSTSFSVTSDTGEYVYFALPVSYGTPTFTIGGFDYEYDLVATFDFTNSSGYTASYNVYQSGQHSLGTMSITVK